MGSNVAPRGLTIRPTPTTTSPVVGAWISDGTAWREVLLGWAWNGTAWVVVWAKQASDVTAVTLTWATSQVTVSWSLPSPEVADSYNIYRPDGSLAGTASSGATSFVDLNPLPLDGAYTVKAVLGGVESAGAVSADLDLLLPPDALLASVTNDGTTSASVVLSWGFTGGRQPDQWRVYRGASLVATLTGVTTTWTDTGPSIGAATVYTVEPVLSGVASAGSDAALVFVAPCVPTAVTLTAPNPPINTLRFAWSSPSAGAVTGYEVQAYIGGSWVAHATVTPPAALTTDLATSDAASMRVRAVAPGGNSSWVTAGPVAPVTDVTPPGAGTMSAWQPATSYGRMTASYVAPSDSDLATIELQYRKNGGAWTTFHGPVSATPGQVFASVYAATGVAGDVFEVRSKTTDVTGNVATSGTLSTYTLVASPTYVPATGTTLYQAGDGTPWNPAGDSRPAQGYYSGSPTRWNIGIWVYGTQPSDLLYNSGRRTIVSGRVYLARGTWGSSSWLAPHFWMHDYTTRPTSGPVPALYSGPAVLDGTMRSETAGGGQNLAWSNLPAGWAAALVAGTRKGLASYVDGNGQSPWFNYQAVTGGENADCGKLEISHLG